MDEIHQNLCKKVAVLTKSIVYLNMKVEDTDLKRQAERRAHESALLAIESAANAKLEALVQELDPKGIIQRYEKVVLDLTERHTEEKAQAIKDLAAHAEAFTNARIKNETSYLKRLSEFETEINTSKASFDMKYQLLVHEKLVIEEEKKSLIEKYNKMIKDIQIKHVFELEEVKKSFDKLLNEEKVKTEGLLQNALLEKQNALESLFNDLTNEKLITVSLLESVAEKAKIISDNREKELIKEIESERSSKSLLELQLHEQQSMLETQGIDLKQSKEETRLAIHNYEKSEKKVQEANFIISSLQQQLSHTMEQVTTSQSLLITEQTTSKKLASRVLEVEAMLNSLKTSGLDTLQEVENLKNKLVDAMTKLTLSDNSINILQNDLQKLGEESLFEKLSLENSAKIAKEEAKFREEKLVETISTLQAQLCSINVSNNEQLLSLRSQLNILKGQLDESLNREIQIKIDTQAEICSIQAGIKEQVQIERTNCSIELTEKHNEILSQLEVDYTRRILETRSEFEQEAIKETSVWEERVARLQSALESALLQLDSSSTSRLVDETNLRTRVNELESMLSQAYLDKVTEKTQFENILKALSSDLKASDNLYKETIKKFEEEKAILIKNGQINQEMIQTKAKEEMKEIKTKLKETEEAITTLHVIHNNEKEEYNAKAALLLSECESSYRSKLEASSDVITRLERLLQEKEVSSAAGLGLYKERLEREGKDSEKQITALINELAVVKRDAAIALNSATIASETAIADMRSILLFESSLALEALKVQHSSELNTTLGDANIKHKNELDSLRHSLKNEFTELLTKTEKEFRDEASRLISLERENHLILQKKVMDELQYTLELDHSRAMRDVETLNRSREISALEALKSSLNFDRIKSEENLRTEIKAANEVAVMATETSTKQRIEMELEIEKLRIQVLDATKKSRPEDISRIERLVAIVKQKEEEVKFFKLELINRETNFNKVFSGGSVSGNGGGSGFVITTSGFNDSNIISSSSSSGSSSSQHALAVGSGPRAVTALALQKSGSVNISSTSHTGPIETQRRSNSRGGELSNRNEAPVSLGFGPGGHQPPSPTTTLVSKSEQKKRDPPSVPKTRNR
jgi:hypothetical protein